MSARAAWRLADLGFREVYDYTAGRADWLAAGLPAEGPLAAVPSAASLCRTDMPTCAPDEPVGAAVTRMRDTGVPLCAVVNDRRVVLGAIDAATAADACADAGGGGKRPAREVMMPGPQTIRPDARELPGWIRRRPPAAMIVTRSDGTLVGLLEDPARLD